MLMRVRPQVLQLTTASTTLVVSTDTVAVVADVLGANLLSAVAVVGVGFVRCCHGWVVVVLVLSLAVAAVHRPVCDSVSGGVITCVG